MVPIVEVERVSKVFKGRRGAKALLGREGIGAWFRRSSAGFTALDDVSFAVEPGQAIGIIGQNGSGKSTLLKLIAGVTLPTTGRVTVRGRVASLLELGAGFHPMLTGRENVYLNAGLLGVRHADVDRLFDDIVAFSGIGGFVESPVATYSSGMYVRLAFAVAVHTNPDVFLVDEVLSVGDEEFQRKCRRRIGELREQGKTILFVSHDLGIVNSLCDGVVLLHEGRIIARDTPRQTIEFYLRMVGGSGGVHVFKQGDTEVISSHGKLALFHRRQEVSAPNGFDVLIRSLESEHPSRMAAWTVEDAGPDGCAARGLLPRLPMAHRWESRLEEGRLVWRLAVECERETPMDSFAAHLHLPTGYTEWIYGDLSGRFPELRPQDVTWDVLVSPEVSARDLAALPRPDLPLPPLRFRIDSERPYLSVFWANTDYVTGSRVLRVEARFPSEAAHLPPGRHELFTITVDPTLGAEELRRRMRAERTLASGPATALFEAGRIRLFWEDQEVTAAIHAYASMLISTLWNDSLSLQWERVFREGDRLEASAHSRRFPYRQHWTLEPVEGGFAWRIDLEVLEPLDVQEYHASVVLDSAYARWRTDRESGEYPPFEPGREDWRHLNRDYTPGQSIRAEADGLPNAILHCDLDGVPFRMTALNTGHSVGARVLQALRVPEAGLLHFEPGRYPYFAGRILLEPPAETR
jgi:ABC-type polysaccharide/polyol phosphate transport system ATPase subunit